MRRSLLKILLMFGVGNFSASLLFSDPPEDVSSKQRENGLANWKRVFQDENPSSEETAHFLLIAPSSILAKQLKSLGGSLEKENDLLHKVLQMPSKENPWEGKITVYVIDERRPFNSFLRAVEKRSPQADDVGVYSLKGKFPHIIAGPPAGKSDPNPEAQACEQFATALLSKKTRSELPEWLLAGFGRATAMRVVPTAYGQARKQIRNLVLESRTALDVWKGSLPAEEATLLRGSFVEYLAYGPSSKTFISFTEAFQPDEGKMIKTTEEAIKSLHTSPEYLAKAWQSWILKSR